MAALLQELIEEILPRLPVKSLLRFKTVSKKWHSLISQNHKFHLKQKSLSSASKNLLIFQISSNGDIFQSSDVDTLESRIFKHPLNMEMSLPTSRLIGSANGLVCVVKNNLRQYPSKERRCYCFLWNPSTGDQKRISTPLLTYRGGGLCSLFGFGYDSVSDDYKILGHWDFQLWLFSLRSNSWKTLGYSSSIKPSTIPAFYLNGALHWCAGPHITGFDLAEETIFYLELPEEINIYLVVPLFGYQGCLCGCGPDSVWMMKEYGNKSSWAKLVFALPEVYAVPRGVSVFGGVVFCSGDGSMYAQSGSSICSNYESKMILFGEAFAYQESLISPKCFDQKDNEIIIRPRKQRKTL